jgi:hypothetical protein
MSDLTFGVRMDGNGNLAGEAKAVAASITDLKKSTDDLTAASVRLNQAQKDTATGWTIFKGNADQYQAAIVASTAAHQRAAEQIYSVNDAFLKTAGGAEQVQLATSHATREMMILGHEVATGNISRLPYTLIQIVQGLSPVGLEIAAVTALVVAGGYAWYEWEKASNKAVDAAKAGLDAAQKAADKSKQMNTVEKIAADNIKIHDLELENTYDLDRINKLQETQRTASNNRKLADEIMYLSQSRMANKEHILNLQKDAATLQEQLDKKDAAQFKAPVVDPNDTAVINMQTEAIKKQMEASGVSAAETNVYILATKGATIAQIDDAQAAAELTDASLNQISATKAATKAADDAQKLREQGVITIMNETEQISKKADAAELENVKIGQTKEQLDALNLARIDEQIMSDAILAAGMRDVDGYQAQVDAIDAQIEALGRLRNAEAAKPAAEAAHAAASASAAEYKKAGDEMNRALTDGLMRAFESGKGYAQAFRDTLVNMFKTTILQPTISYILTPVSGGMAAMFSDGSAAQTMTNAQGVSMTTTGSEAAGGMATAGWVGLAVVAAAAIINRMGYDHGNPSAAQVQSVQATGQVFGDMLAKSATIAQVSQAIKLNSDDGLVYSKGMLDALTLMNNNIGSFAAMIVRTNPSLATGANFTLPGNTSTWNTSGLTGNYGLNSISASGSQVMSASIDALQGALNPSLLAKFNSLGSILGGKTSSNVTDTGLAINGTIGGLMQGSGIQQYMNSNTTTSSYFGLEHQTNANPTQYAAVGADFNAAFAKIFSNLHDVMINAGKALGMDVSGMDALIKNFDISTQISLKGLSGQALSDAVSQVITNMSDKIVKTTFADVMQYQQVGEDALTTLVRVANETEMVSISLDRIGVAAKPAAANMMGVAEALIAAAGGAANYSSMMDYFSKNFLTTAQQLVPAQNAVNKAFADLNMAVPDSKAAFTALMQSADVSTASGQALQIALLNIAPAFNAISTAAGDATAKLMALIKTDSFSTSLAYTMAMAKAMAPSTPAQVVAPSDQAQITSAQHTTFGQALIDGSAWGKKLHDTIMTVVANNAKSASVPGFATNAMAPVATKTAIASVATNAMAPSTLKVPGFASGGDFGGGVRMVGEVGRELEFTGPSRIMNNADTNKLLDNTEMVTEIKALRAEVAKLRISNEDTARSSRKVSDLLRRVTQDGNSLMTTPA